MNTNKLMYKAQVMILAILAIFVMSSATWATTYYVDATNGNDSNPGKSETDCWKTISKVNNYYFQAGDFILFKRGENWTQRLVVPSLGSSGNRITFGAYGSGNKPTIRGIYASNKSYITIENIMVKNYASPDAGIDIVDNSNYVTIDNCVIENNVYDGISFWCPNHGNGIVVSNCIIQNNGSHNSYNTGICVKATDGSISGNTIYHNGYGDSKWGYSHGIYIDTGANSFDIYGNVIYGNDRGHGIQSKSSANIYRNLIYNNAIGGVFFGENDSNDVIGNIYSNIFYSNKMGITQYSKGSGNLNLIIYNNSFYHNVVGYTWTAEILIENNLDSLTIKNNIIYSSNGFDAYDIISQNNADIDYNCVYRSCPGNFIKYQGTSRTWSYWKNVLGFDVNGINSNAEYADASERDFQLQPTSPCIGRGTNVGLTQDFSGSLVPQGKKVDIGAYVYGGEDTKLAPPTGLRIVRGRPQKGMQSKEEVSLPTEFPAYTTM